MGNAVRKLGTATREGLPRFEQAGASAGVIHVDLAMRSCCALSMHTAALCEACGGFVRARH